jgi:hypothetical protein
MNYTKLKKKEELENKNVSKIQLNYFEYLKEDKINQ